MVKEKGGGRREYISVFGDGDVIYCFFKVFKVSFVEFCFEVVR